MNDSSNNTILELKHISFSVKEKKVSDRLTNKTILDDINFNILNREIFGITGESGCGKTTLAKIISGLLTPDSGEKFLEGKKFTGIDKDYRIQFLFQNYSASHNPLMINRKSLFEIFSLAKLPKDKFQNFAEELLHQVRLNKNILDMYPYELSGGQQQRLALAKILGLKPKIIILDEPFASQDVNVQVELLDLLKDLNENLGITFIVISHDLIVLQKLARRIMVMYNGEIVEIIESKKFLKTAIHPYTKFLIENFTANYEVKKLDENIMRMNKNG